MYLINNIDQIHHLMNLKNWFLLIVVDRRE